VPAERRYAGQIAASLPDDRVPEAGREHSTLFPAELEVVASDRQGEVGRALLSVQVLDDSPELLRPQPDRPQLETLAEMTSGRVLNSAADLAAVLREYPSTPGEVLVHHTPVWDRTLFWVVLLGLLAVEWTLRRKSGFG
ncbi:MAG: hypothetical protein J5I93_02915, partial [Pirellulaceae bacterium]|nr:hypothetical protein [Pirellulaceae bacterium]